MGGSAAKRAPIEWEIGVPLVTNRRMLSQMALAFGLGAAIAYLFVAIALAAQGAWKSLAPLALGFAGADVGFFLLGLLIMLAVFGNRMTMRFRVDGASVTATTVDRRARALNRVAIVAGALTGKANLAGAGLIARSGEEVETGWPGIRHAVFEPRRRAIALRNRWRTVVVLYCTAENYGAVAELVRANLAAVPAASRPKAGSPIPALLAWTAGVIVASFPAFVLPYPFTLDLLMPMVMLAFAVTTVWLIPLFGYVVMFCAAYLVFEVVAIGAATRRNQFTGRIYSGFETLDGGEWAALGLFAVGIAFLVWFGIRAVRGRIPSALANDMAEMDRRR